MATFSPALGSKTCAVSSSTFQFLAAADTKPAGSGSSLQVWTDLSGSWQEHTFQEHTTPFGSVLVAQVPISREGSYQFTYRIREPSDNIVWLSQAGGNDNGTVLIGPKSAVSDFNPLSNADEAGEIIQEESSKDISTQVIKYSLTDGKEGEVESFRIITLGGWSSGLTIERSQATWFTARTLNAFSGLSPHSDCQLLLYQNGSQVVACFPLSLPDASSTLRGCMEGTDAVWLRSERDSSGPAQAQCVVTWGPNSKLLDVIDSCTATAKKSIDASGSPGSAIVSTNHSAESNWSLHETTKAVYCTWNSLGQNYTYSGVVYKLKALRGDGNLGHYESLLLDDGWQDVARSTDNQRLTALRSFGLRDGWIDEDIPTMDGESKLAAAVRNIKQVFPEIKTVGVWMTIEGYWNGLHPDSRISRTYKLTRYGVRDNHAQYPYPPPFEYFYLPSPEDTKRYWTDYLTTLKQAGIDFVKIDNQASLDYLVGEGAAAMRSMMSRTARTVAREIFGPGNLINCMAGSPRYYNEFLSEHSEPAVSLRTSGDFYPNEPDSHRFHVAFNSTTAFLDRKLAVTRDFDMFMTHHDLAEYHALLRCFTTAPMYITDSDPSNKQIYERLGGPDPHGEYHIIKATSNTSVRLPSTAFTDVTANGNGTAIKVALSVPHAKGTILGFWNCRGEGGIAVDALTKREISEALSMDAQENIANKRYVLMDDAVTTHLLDDLTEDEDTASSIVLPLQLNPGTCKAVTIAQLVSYPDFEMAVLGLADKFVGLCAVLEIEKMESSPKEEMLQVNGYQDDAKASGNGEESKVNGFHEADPTQVDQVDHNSSETTGQISSTEDTSEPTSETTPLLSKDKAPTTTTSSRTGSRLWALLLFYRQDLREARAAFLRDFFRSPLKAIWSDIKAIFVRSSKPVANGDNEQPDDISNGTPKSVADMQETVDATPRSYGTLDNGPDGGVEQEGDISLASESSNTTAVDQPVSANQVVIKLSVAGKLLLWLPDFSSEIFSITLQGEAIPQKMISISGSCVVVDMESASQALELGGKSGNVWQVGVYRK